MQLITALSFSPAKILDIVGGSLIPAARLILSFRPDSGWVVKGLRSFVSNSRISPFQSLTQGLVDATYVNGVAVYTRVDN